MTPSLYRCGKCKNVVVVEVKSKVTCLRCAKPMKRLTSWPEEKAIRA